ncbi:DUF368 domain-containing protein [Endozoicomonas sp. SM1973]|uniref:DUF368 domain-containing protein n=1 Tax=Spartinivicinus marinus TaxID=2994442 RepID=A0A853I7Z5_9GAMM|nr:DUF368 domain-containing protein [Spartinivicinus marinus]MCX4025426.1 DUF368 domain-containing protein [Spartinivicinus marinus]NYZ65345.1 DUF368 domain-containing protein [Spartinivicinus marinus]
MSQKLEFATLFAKGAAMGAADVVPGVSGGTIAFIVGIYDRLLQSVSHINHRAIRLLFTKGFKAAWEYIDGNFLFTLLLGIVFSILTFARVISYLLATYPILLWSFFFGLIVISSFYVGKEVNRWGIGCIISGVVGGVLAIAVSTATPAEITASYPMFFLGGMVAICAMILPGISGSFILLLFGLYGHVMLAIKEFNFVVLAVLAAGCLAGLMMFSNILHWLLKHKREVTLAFLTGLMVGSLSKVWPWKQTISFRLNSHGEQVPLVQHNVLPWQFQASTGQSDQLLVAITIMLMAIVLVIAIDKGQKLLKTRS